MVNYRKVCKRVREELFLDIEEKCSYLKSLGMKKYRKAVKMEKRKTGSLELRLNLIASSSNFGAWIGRPVAQKYFEVFYSYGKKYK